MDFFSCTLGHEWLCCKVLHITIGSVLSISFVRKIGRKCYDLMFKQFGGGVFQMVCLQGFSRAFNPLSCWCFRLFS